MHDQRFKNIHQFIACVQTGSFTEAGKRLHLSPSAISKAIQALEQRLACRLFERTTRTLQLTDAGNTYYETCLQILRQLTETETALQLSQDLPTGKVALALPETFGKVVVLPILCSLMQRYPELRLTLHFSDTLLELEQEKIDIAVRIGGGIPLAIQEGFQHFGYEKMVFCASPSFIKEYGMPATLSDLCAQHIVGYQAQNGQMKPWIIPTDNPPQAWHPSHYRLIVNNTDAHLMAVSHGIGVAQLPYWLIKEKLERGELVLILPQVKLEGLPLTLRYKAAQQSSPKIQAVLNALHTLSLVN
ncbi:DNA-binding transcriptional regulator, LysR family [Rosenbergiella nectarea]|uniref:DNA-binding transcriptional regulator, LysR family n=1 Tax=Rosenbergiella nectarea TaxID=988801 RepID=A0A1H9E555_9GAMM|nr:LysR family transcriptional regulator [Rosenbergiella nectarea]SEQ20809.1 DNA-binding transcriptional regulator, LysR family [Rosenbergiella nectarea]